MKILEKFINNGETTIGTLMSNAINTPLQYIGVSIQAFTATFAKAHGIKPFVVSGPGPFRIVEEQ